MGLSSFNLQLGCEKETLTLTILLTKIPPHSLLPPLDDEMGTKMGSVGGLILVSAVAQILGSTTRRTSMLSSVSS
jgi:hypothetical protein